MSSFTILILIAFAVGAFGFIDEETELSFTDESSSSEDVFDRIGESEGKIIGGRDAVRGQFPHQVSIRHISYGHFCGGSILNRLFVLTAAQCTERQESIPANIRVVAGALRSRNDGIIHEVHSIYIHPRFDRRRRANIVSIIRTVTDILFDTCYVRPVRLPIANVPEAGNYPVYFSGWGWTSDPGSMAQTLQFKDALTLNRQHCIARMGTNGGIVHENTVCVHNPVGRGACLGDTGGALISHNGVQVGISSLGYPCASGAPDIYANVWSHIEWIKATIRANWNSTQLE